MKARRYKRVRLAFVAFLLFWLVLGCQARRSVQITLVSTPQPGQEASFDGIALVEGQAMGIRVYAVKNGKIRDKWKMRALSNNESVAPVFKTNEGHVFVIAGAHAGKTDVAFLSHGRTVHVPLTVRARGDWTPGADHYSFGGAGGFGGALP